MVVPEHKNGSIPFPPILTAEKYALLLGADVLDCCGR
jgi:hypothetical protein